MPTRESRPEGRQRWPSWPLRSSVRVHSAPAGWAWVAAAALLGVGAALLMSETRGTTFWADEWQWILTRRGGGLASLLDPHNSHLSLIPVVIYKVLFATVGLGRYWPYRAVLVAMDLACAWLVFVYARSRVGGYLALLAAGLILFFGPGWQDILWPFQMSWLIAVAAGIGALLLLDRDDRAGDCGACLLVGISLASSGPGLAVAIGLAVEVLQRRRPRDTWIVAAPIALYALWWVGYQQTTVAAHSLLLVPRFTFDAAAGVLSALAGLAEINVGTDTGTYLTWGAPLLALAVVAMVWRLSRLGGIPPRVLTLLAMTLGFWVLTGIGRAYLSVGPLVLTATGDESRYLYVGAVFVALLAVELARGSAPSWRMRVIAGVLVAAAVVSNIAPLRDGSRFLRSQAQVTDTELGTLNISRPIVKPDYVSNGFVFGTVTAQAWFAAEQELGSAAASAAQIAAFPEAVRESADAQLIKIQPLGLTAPSATLAAGRGVAPTVDGVQSAAASLRGDCVSFRPTSYTPVIALSAIALTVPAGGVLIRNGNAPAMIGVRRFATQFEPLGTLAATAQGVLRVAPDLAHQPWHVQITAGGPVIVCDLE
jgi:hypothetical protein